MALENIEKFIKRQDLFNGLGRRKKRLRAFLAAIGRRGWVKTEKGSNEYVLGDFRLGISQALDEVLLGNGRSIKLGRGAIDEFDAFMKSNAPRISL